MNFNWNEGKRRGRESSIENTKDENLQTDFYFDIGYSSARPKSWQKP